MMFGLEERYIVLSVTVDVFKSLNVGIFYCVISRRLYLLMMVGCSYGPLTSKATILYLGRNLVPPYMIGHEVV